jgi:hypothetical protein
MVADKGYIHKGLSGWTITLLYRSNRTVKFFHGYADWDVALTALKMFWRDAPADQNGFPTEWAL